MADDRSAQPDKGDLDAKARDWIAREKLGTLSPQEQADANSWRRQSMSHEDAYQNALALWAMTAQASRRFDVSAPERPTRRRFLQTGAVAASAAGLAYSASWIGMIPTWQAVIADYSTGRGEQQKLVLSKRLTVDLDGETSLDADERFQNLTLQRGAAVFSLSESQDDTAQITVSSGPGEVSAKKGTFSVLHRPNTVEVACLDGTVRVQSNGNANLKRGQMIGYSSSGLTTVAAKNSAEIASWRTGYLIFRDRALIDVVADLNRHRPGRLVLAGDAIGQRRVSGTFGLDNLDNVVLQLTSAFGLKAREIPGGIVFLS